MRPIEFNDKVQAIPLGQTHVDGGEVARLTGWGRLGADLDGPNDLQVNLLLITIYNKLLFKSALLINLFLNNCCIR